MSKDNENIGSRGGSSYWTIYRLSNRNVSSASTSNISVSQVIEPNSSTGNVSSAPPSVESAANNPENLSTVHDSDAIDEDLNAIDSDEELSFFDEYEKIPILSAEDESMDDNNIEEAESMDHFQLEKESSTFDGNVTETLRNLALRHPDLSNLFLRDMLGSLRTIGLNVPKDPRTLLHAPSKPIPLRAVEPGVYWHYGFQKLIDKLLSHGVDVPESLDILVNMDGLPIAVSSKAVLWPILMSINNFPIKKPFILGIYFHEKSKPKNVSEYLKDFVDDLKIMKTQGYRGIFVKKVCYPLDAPALAFIKEVQYHSGMNSCNKCTIVGVSKSRRVCFPTTAIGSAKRTDALFRNHTTYGKHHRNKQPGPLEADELGTDMVMDFLIEPLHAIDLGVMKKKVLCWLKYSRYGDLYDSFNLRLTDHKIEKIDAHLTSIRATQPTDFNRPSREISLVKYWKGAELSCLLHYTGPVVLKDILHKEVYNNFLLLHVASTICSTKQHSTLWPLTKTLFEKYVTSFKTIYEEYAMSYNIHNLIHITDDLMHHKLPMSDYSVTSFEHKLGEMKKLIRGGNRRLEQVATRVEELIDYEIEQFKSKLDAGILHIE